MMETLNRLQAHADASGIAVLQDDGIPLDPVTSHGGEYDFIGNYVLLQGFDSTLLALVLAHELGHAEQRNLYLGALTWSMPNDTLVRVEADAWHRGIALYLDAGGEWSPDLSAFVLRCLGSYLTPMMDTALQDELFEIDALCRDLEGGTT